MFCDSCDRWVERAMPKFRHPWRTQRVIPPQWRLKMMGTSTGYNCTKLQYINLPYSFPRSNVNQHKNKHHSLNLLYTWNQTTKHLHFHHLANLQHKHQAQNHNHAFHVPPQAPRSSNHCRCPSPSPWSLWTPPRTSPRSAAQAYPEGQGRRSLY